MKCTLPGPAAMILISVIGLGSAQAGTLCPDGKWHATGDCKLCPDGSYTTAPQCLLAPSERYVPGYGGGLKLAPDGRWIPDTGSTVLCPNGKWAAGTHCVMLPDGRWIGQQ
jgi:hypothetical protein